MTRDWLAWHEAYDRPGSDLARRLDVVVAKLSQVLDVAPAGTVRLLSLCAGDGRDVLSVLASHPRAGDVSAVLVESHPTLATLARSGAQDLISRIDVRAADAGDISVWSDAVPAQIVLACGVFGNLARDQVEHCIATLPVACAPAATLLWTRGRGPEDPGPDLDRWLKAAHFQPLARVAPERARYRVGADRYTGPPRPANPNERLFTTFR